MATKYFTKAALLFAFTMTGSSTLNAQDNDSLIQQRIRYQQYVFVPQTFSSPSITMPVTTRDFELRVTTDSIIAILPYYGQSHSAQFGRSDDDGIKFTSTDFEYSAVVKKKGKWEITIKPKDAKGIRLFLTVYNNGEAQMDVTSPGKESMLFKGYVW
jgi:Domain of unknown function (DUF4251)